MGTRTNFFRAFGGGTRDRTADLLHAMQALSQLSYTPTFERQPNYLDTKAFASYPKKNRTDPVLFNVGGVDGTRTRDPRRDRPVF